jgi:hypothetical protein
LIKQQSNEMSSVNSPRHSIRVEATPLRGTTLFTRARVEVYSKQEIAAILPSLSPKNTLFHRVREVCLNCQKPLS